MGWSGKPSLWKMRISQLLQEQGKEGKPREEKEFGALKDKKEPVQMEYNEQREDGMKQEGSRQYQALIYHLGARESSTWRAVILFKVG